jgi:TPR repeat protein
MAGHVIIRTGLLLLLSCPLVLLAGPAFAQSSFDNCASYASSQYEAGYESTGRDNASMDIPGAIAACEAALAEAPNSIAIKAWLARAYQNDGNSTKSVPLFEEAAAAHNVVALALLGDMLITGDGVAQDMARGAEMLRTGAELGFAPAQNSLGLSYDLGEGVAQDYAEAVRWYRAAAEQGLPRAATNLGLMYFEGLGTNGIDYVAAAAWLQRAADRGDARAQYNLGRIYESGLMVEPSDAAAGSYYQQAADQGDMFAQNGLGYLLQHGYGMTADPSTAASWYQKAADQGLPLAQYNLALLYEDGHGVPQDTTRARELYEQAANAGELSAAANLGAIYISLLNDAEALHWTQIAADGGEAVGLNNLGHLHEYGLGVDADVEKAKEFYQRSADLGYALAADNLARLNAPPKPTYTYPIVEPYPPSKLDN